MAKVRNETPTLQLDGLGGTSSISTLATSTLLDDLTGAELVVLVRLMRAWWLHGSSVQVRNIDLHRQSNTARVALAGLVEHGLIKVKRGPRGTRLIERRR